jgi:cellulose 1,4-beta-cellobiosidase
MNFLSRPSGRRRFLALACAGALAAAGLVATASPAHAATVCDIDYQATPWTEGPSQGGFTAHVTINNLEDPVSGWTLQFALPSGQGFTQGWSANWSGSSTLTATNLEWNGNLGTGGSTTIGFNGTWTGAYSDPAAFTLNGVACDGGGDPGNQPPTATLTSPSNGAEFPAGSTVPLTATATDPDGSIDRVEFFVDGNLVATDTTAPYSASATGLAAGSHTARAIAFDNGSPQLSGESALVMFSIAGGGGNPSILANPGSLGVDEGGSEQVTISLSEAPSGTVTVSLGLTGDPSIGVSPTSLSFNSGNWNSGLSATVSAAEDGDQVNGTATLTASAAGHNSATVNITEIDNDQPGGDDRVDNPYLGADVYVNPDWSEAAQTGGAPSSIFNQPTGVWLDRIAAIDSGSAGSNTMGLADHLDEAVAQDAANGGDPMVFQVVIYNLPGRDCSALASNGELGPNDLPIYESQYIDVIAGIMSQPQYADLRIVAIIEIDSLPNLVTNTSGQPGGTALCDQMLQNGGYVDGVGYAVSTLGAIPNVYNYIDAAHHGWIGWDSNFNPTANIILQAANANGASPDDVHGFITNTANYSALEEPFIDINGTIGGQQIRQASWIDFNQYNDELTFAQAFRNQLDQVGFASDIGMLIDTSRNGWGGAARPTGPSSSTVLDTFVNESRIDRRIHKGNWCNQSGAGLGERPQAAPEPGIDAYVWIKPPGESDGSSEFIENDEGKGFDEMCDPTYGGNARNGNNPSGALPNAPISGHWFQAQFDELMDNAFPPVS